MSKEVWARPCLTQSPDGHREPASPSHSQISVGFLQFSLVNIARPLDLHMSSSKKLDLIVLPDNIPLKFKANDIDSSALTDLARHVPAAYKGKRAAALAACRTLAEDPTKLCFPATRIVAFKFTNVQYSQVEIDEVREEWAKCVLTHVLN